MSKKIMIYNVMFYIIVQITELYLMSFTDETLKLSFHFLLLYLFFFKYAVEHFSGSTRVECDILSSY